MQNDNTDTHKALGDKLPILMLYAGLRDKAYLPNQFVQILSNYGTSTKELCKLFLNFEMPCDLLWIPYDYSPEALSTNYIHRDTTIDHNSLIEGTYIGCLSKLHGIESLSDGNMQINVSTISRVQVFNVIPSSNITALYYASYEPYNDITEYSELNLTKLIEQVKELYTNIYKLNEGKYFIGGEEPYFLLQTNKQSLSDYASLFSLDCLGLTRFYPKLACITNSPTIRLKEIITQLEKFKSDIEAKIEKEREELKKEALKQCDKLMDLINNKIEK